MSRSQLKDFLGRDLNEGDWVIYPNGPHNLVLARIEIIKYIKFKHQVKVRRYQAGKHRAGTDDYWSPDPSRVHALVYSDKLIKVDKPDWVDPYIVEVIND